ncbi:MAG: N-acetylgalactosamine 6-sulfate sulfatase, partial [Pirellulales bacterium]
TGRFRLDHAGNLYDVLKDPGQRTNISRQRPQIKSRLTAALKAWKSDVFADYDHSERPLLIGHPDVPFTQLPARDGVAHGNIHRSSRHPNCSYFTNWTSIDDRITWDAEVGATGTYEVELYYTCPASDVGSTIELSCNGSRLQAAATEPHDPPLRGAEHDRVQRQESYVKDFRPLKLGTIHLEKGRGELALRALKIPGSQVMDFQLLILARVED